MSLTRWGFVFGAAVVGTPIAAAAASARSSGFALGTALAAAAVVLAAVPGGAWDALREIRWALARRRSPHAPWVVDRAWNPRGERRAMVRRMVDDGLLVALMWTSLLAGVGVFTSMSASLVARAATLVCAVAVAAVLLVVISRAARGSVEVLYPAFPIRPGTRAEFFVGCSPSGPAFESCTLTLRRVEENRASRYAWTTDVVTTWSAQVAPAPPPGPGDTVVAAFDIPQHLGGTRLASLTPVVWELVVDAQVEGSRHLDRFLVPVYGES